MVKLIKGVEYYTVEEFANHLRVSKSTVQRWIDEGALQYWRLRPNSTIRIPASELDNHIQK